VKVDAFVTESCVLENVSDTFLA